MAHIAAPTPVTFTDDTGLYPGAVVVTPDGGTLFPVALSDGSGNPITSTAGALNVSATFSGSISGNAAASATGSAVPADADYIGVNISGNLVGVTGISLTNAKAIAVGIVDGSGNQITSFGGGTQYATGSAQATPTVTETSVGANNAGYGFAVCGTASAAGTNGLLCMMGCGAT